MLRFGAVFDRFDRCFQSFSAPCSIVFGSFSVRFRFVFDRFGFGFWFVFQIGSFSVHVELSKVAPTIDGSEPGCGRGRAAAALS